ncbi:hydroxymethylpyrimidine ABC transporter [Halalkalibacter wakoensis JCM 9140]|uniref:Hydroxymethylpyrimidine ABC transporter n=1 Tax=Halalkalibacter wakoensis JCM 9140 TaxID=1236970 RepID=W4Q0T8_9BACI|nr:ABC transporter substrate-binding protein [Halalkalibacter wakoensis]GAE25592.1 hydroxymethylpyrimidine ABC transporter [Halalkalibacter wakoensis JCM 9140]
MFKKLRTSLVVAGMFVLAACNQVDEPTQVEEVETEVESDAGAEAPAESEELMEATFILDWVPNTNHTGIYVALEKGFFEEEGIDLTIIEPAMEGAVPIVAAGQADFGIGSQTGVTIARSTGIPVASIAAVIQEHTSGFASPIEKEITSPEDFAGKTYGGFGGAEEEAILNTVLNQYEVDPASVDNVIVGSADFFTNTKRDIDFQWIFYGWTGIEAEVRGEDINMIYLKDIDPVFNYYSPVIFSSDAVMEEQPELVESFTRAVSRGYEFAIEEPAAAAEILIAASPETSEELIRASQEWLSPRYKGDAEKWGIQSEDVWNDFTAWLLEAELIESDVSTDEVMTNRFLP